MSPRSKGWNDKEEPSRSAEPTPVSEIVAGIVCTVKRRRVLPSAAGASSYTPSVRMRLFLPVRPASTMRCGRSTSTKVTSAQLKRLPGTFTRKRAPAPRPTESSRVRCQSTR